MNNEGFGRNHDSFCLGWILYQMCTFEDPFEVPGNSEKTSWNIKKCQPDFSLVPEIYSSKTKQFIKLLLVKKEFRPKVSELMLELEEHTKNVIAT